MGVARVQKKPSDGTIASASAVLSVSVTLNSTTTSGNALIAWAWAYNAGANPAITFSDDGSHSWQRPVHQASSTQARLAIGYVLGITGKASHQVTATSDITASPIELIVCEISGIGAFGSSNSNSGTVGGDMTPGAVTSAAGDYVLSGVCIEGADPGSGTWTGSASVGSGSLADVLDKIVSTGGSENPLWNNGSSTDDWAAGIVRFTEAITWYDHDGVKPWSSVWRSGRF